MAVGLALGRAASRPRLWIGEGYGFQADIGGLEGSDPIGQLLIACDSQQYGQLCLEGLVGWLVGDLDLGAGVALPCVHVDDAIHGVIHRK